MRKKQWEIKIVADTNDADYVTLVSKISDKDLERIRPVIAAIKAFKPYTGKSAGGMDHEHRHNFPQGEFHPREDLGEKSVQELYGHIVSAEVLELFQDFVPYGEHGIHTIERIEVAPAVSWKKLLDHRPTGDVR